MRARRALVSVHDKNGLLEFAKGLEELGVEILCTGGTERVLKEGGVKGLKSISEYTQQKEILGGRVKTLHPMIFGGILADRDKANHMDELGGAGVDPIDIVVVNLYPFESILGKEGTTTAEAIELIDIGGITLIRAAAKNFKDVAILVSPSQYQQVLEELKKGDGALSEETRRGLALEAFARSSAYDTTIFNYFRKKDALPRHLRVGLGKSGELRYGENPYQPAAFYTDPYFGFTSVHNAENIRGIPLSFNNILDLNSALGIVMEFERPTSAVIKHTVPCGLASADTPSEAYVWAHKSDPLSAFGSVVGFNRKVDAASAEAMRKHFVECLIAPDYDEEALKVLDRKKKLRILKTGPFGKKDPYELQYLNVRGGMLAQETNFPELDMNSLKVVTEKKPTEEQLRTMQFAWKAVRFVKSNGIVLARDTRTIGVGGGQTSRVDAVTIACRKAGEEAKGSVLASDAFFPFRDGIDEAGKAGVSAVIQSGGSKRDEETIKAANEHGMSMVFTGSRLFRH
jgi:phosphoribosylaminoimidazolecarboxamide formyltransferase/IMP cyclohydrolase